MPNLEVLQCQNCQAIVLDDAANGRIDEAMAAQWPVCSRLPRSVASEKLLVSTSSSLPTTSRSRCTHFLDGRAVLKSSSEQWMRFFECFFGHRRPGVLGVPRQSRRPLLTAAGEVSRISEVVQKRRNHVKLAEYSPTAFASELPVSSTCLILPSRPIRKLTGTSLTPYAFAICSASSATMLGQAARL